MRLLTAKIDEGLYARFQAACARDGVSMSDRLRTFVGEVADGLVVVAPVGDPGPLPVPSHALVSDAPIRKVPLPRGSREPVKVNPRVKHRGALREAMDVPAVPGEACGHAVLNKLPYGTWCKDCGRRMR